MIDGSNIPHIAHPELGVFWRNHKGLFFRNRVLGTDSSLTPEDLGVLNEFITPEVPAVICAARYDGVGREEAFWSCFERLKTTGAIIEIGEYRRSADKWLFAREFPYKGPKRVLLSALARFLRSVIRFAPIHALRRAALAYLRRFDPELTCGYVSCRVKTVDGAMMAVDTSAYIQRRLYLFGVWEPHLTAFIRNRLRAGEMFVDVGAHEGYFTLLASMLVGDEGKVLAVEASADMFRNLTRNIALNEFDNVEAMNVAASDSAGSIELHLSSNLPGAGLSSFKETSYDSSNIVRIPAIRLDEAIHDDDKGRIRIIKIDVDGAEYKVIKGLEGIIRLAPPQLEFIVEISVNETVFGGTNDEIFQLFMASGYSAYIIEKRDEGGYLNPTQDPNLTRITAPPGQEEDILFSKLVG